jgi:predicted nuclease of predicted toxin-antitoxin system
MRLFVDEGFPRPAILLLRGLGHHVVWARTDFPGLKDRRLLDFVEGNSCVLLTLDKDLWQLALERPILLKHGGVILFRAYPAIPQILQPLLAATVRESR